MARRRELLESIAGKIADYRAGEIRSRTPSSMDAWISQFDGGVQERCKTGP